MNFLLSIGNLPLPLPLPLPRMTMKSSRCRSSSSSQGQGGRRHNSFLLLSTGIPRMATTMASSSSSSSSSDNLFLVRRFTENRTPYFSLISTDKGESVCDFHSSHFRGRYADYINTNSVNGLMLLSNTPRDYYLTKEEEHLCICKEEEHLWNPSTNEFKLLPPSPTRNHSTHSSTIFHTIAFAFDSESQDYKILRFVTNRFGPGDYDEHLELYSLKNNSWKEILDYPFSCCPRFETCTYTDPTYHFYANGCCYWLRRHPDQFTSFDFATETFSFISIPAHEDGEGWHSHFLDFDGSLARILYTRESTIELWVWNGSWSKKLEIEMVMRAALWFSSDNQYLFNHCYSPNSSCFQVEAYHLPTKESKLFAFHDYGGYHKVTVYPYTHTNLTLA